MNWFWQKPKPAPQPPGFFWTRLGRQSMSLWKLALREAVRREENAKVVKMVKLAEGLRLKPVL